MNAERNRVERVCVYYGDKDLLAGTKGSGRGEDSIAGLIRFSEVLWRPLGLCYGIPQKREQVRDSFYYG